MTKAIQKNEEEINKELKEEVKNEIQEDIKEEEKEVEENFQKIYIGPTIYLKQLLLHHNQLSKDIYWTNNS